MRFAYPVVGRTRAMRKIEPKSIFLVAAMFALYVLLPPSARGQSSVRPGTVEGTVLVLDSGGPSVLPGAKVVLKGSTTLATEADADGKYSFPEVSPGDYGNLKRSGSINFFRDHLRKDHQRCTQRKRAI